MKVEDAYAEASRITRREARNFAWGIAVLPRPKRLAVAALYAFARRVDDIADDPALPVDERRRGLEACREAVQALPAAPAGDAVLIALVDLVSGGLMDAEKTRYASWDELREYCRCVAGAVGLACLAVYQPSDPVAAPPRAEALGLALQQINIMRDVAEDWRLGRVYLPQDELERFGVAEADLAAGRVSPAWHALMEYQGRRAEELMRAGLGLLPLLDRRSALCVRAFAGIYGGLLVQMRGRGYDVFSQRPRLSAVGKERAVAAL